MVTYMYKAIGMYLKGSSRAKQFNLNETFSLPNNCYCLLTMFDSYGDGFGNGDSPLSMKLLTSDGTVLNASLTFANYSISFEFIMGSLPMASPMATPAPTAMLSPSMAPTVTPPTIWIFIVFDVRPEETEWRIEALHDNGKWRSCSKCIQGLTAT